MKVESLLVDYLRQHRASLINSILNGTYRSNPVRRGEIPKGEGGPLRPLLNNFMLNELDKELERREHKSVRYVNDFIILCKSKRSSERVMQSITTFIEKNYF